MDSEGIRVLFISPYFRPYLGGIERAIEGLAFEYLASPQVEAVAVLTAKYAFPRIPMPHLPDTEVTPERIAILRLAGFPYKAPPFYSVPLVWFSPGRIRRYVTSFKPTVVHWVGDGWFWAHAWSWLWSHQKAKVVFTPSFHSLPPSRQWLRPINGLLCKAADRVVTLTTLERRLVRKAYWVPESKLSTIGWGVKLPPASSNGTSRREVRILCVGRLGEHKGQRWLLEVYRRARERFEHPANLVLVGRDEDGEAQIREVVKKWHLEEEVTVFGEASDEELDRWYVESDVFALFSKYEAFGLVFFEALARGLPVLTHAVGASQEVLTHGSVVVPRYDFETAVDSLVRMVNDASWRKSLGAEGREHVMANFTWPTVAERYLELYQSLHRGDDG